MPEATDTNLFNYDLSPPQSRSSLAASTDAFFTPPDAAADLIAAEQGRKRRTPIYPTERIRFMKPTDTLTPSNPTAAPTAGGSDKIPCSAPVRDPHPGFFVDWLFENCRIVFHGDGVEYPIEHVPSIKNMREEIVQKFRQNA